MQPTMIERPTSENPPAYRSQHSLRYYLTKALATILVYLVMIAGLFVF
jgi:hypothetical protein